MTALVEVEMRALKWYSAIVFSLFAFLMADQLATGQAAGQPIDRVHALVALVLITPVLYCLLELAIGKSPNRVLLLYAAIRATYMIIDWTLQVAFQVGNVAWVLAYLLSDIPVAYYLWKTTKKVLA